MRETRATGAVDERDELTGVRGYYTLLNGFDFDEYVGEDVYVLLADVDNFRMVNDAYGENCGNGLLARVGATIQKSFGDDHTFRYGSDEFIIANAFFDEDALLDKLENLFHQVADIELDGKKLHLTLSVGYVYGKINSQNELHEAIHHADRKMYEAKRLGKARAVGAALEDFVQHDDIDHSGAGAYKSYEIDELTGLANLIHFRSKLDELLARGVQLEGAQSALVYFNIENFKAYNQFFGFDAGDELLLLVSEAISAAFPGCLAARFSADQFMVLTTEAEAIPGILSVRSAFRKKIKDSSIWLKAGVNVLDETDTDAGVVCDRAKLACDAIKGRRDVYYRVYDAELKHQVIQRRYVLDHLDDALNNRWVQVYYQPIYELDDDGVCDEEALARWIDPEEGLISPAVIIPVLEEARLIHKLDLYMLRQACESYVNLKEQGAEVPPVSINLSRLDFELCDIVAEVESVLEEYSVPRELVSIEVTESALTGNKEFLKGEIDRFRAAGFEVWMDDFGSGYSSLHTLTDYSFDLVKVDMAFLRGFETNEQSHVLLSHIISLAKALGLKTLVEGVETQEQYDFLKSIGCDYAQGFHLGRPSPARSAA